MKNPIRTIFALAFCLTVAGLAIGCSREVDEGKNVNVSAMTAALKGEDSEGRINACIELAKAGERAAPAVPALIPLLKDKDPLTRRLAAYALGQVGPKASQAIPALKELLNDTDRDVLTSTINAIRSIDPKSAPGGQIPNVATPQ